MMTTEEILKLAEQANVSIRGHYDETGSTPAELLRFADLVANAQRQWVGLTDDEIDSIQQNNNSAYHLGDTSPRRFARAIEAKLKEKNARKALDFAKAA
jgi:hypothetical protein